MEHFLGSFGLPDVIYHKPGEVPEALALLREHKGKGLLVAGCTDIIPMIRRGKLKLLPGTHLIDLKGVERLGDISVENGKVTVPRSFHELWRLWNEGEWRRLDIPQEFGGQGMPVTIGMAANEYFEAGNLAFQTLAAMTRGAALLIASHGTEEQKEKYVEKILSGQWTGTMDLTEAGAGSDVGATKTVAERNPDGTYSIRGSKIFITGGDTDLTENIIHLALARVKGAPAGKNT